MLAFCVRRCKKTFYTLGINGWYERGIELPEQPGEEIIIRPQPAHLSWCQARVPWMTSHVQVWWSQSVKGLQAIVSLPAGQKGKFIEPTTGRVVDFITSLTL